MLANILELVTAQDPDQSKRSMDRPVPKPLKIIKSNKNHNLINPKLLHYHHFHITSKFMSKIQIIKCFVLYFFIFHIKLVSFTKFRENIIMPETNFTFYDMVTIFPVFFYLISEKDRYLIPIENSHFKIFPLFKRSVYIFFVEICMLYRYLHIRFNTGSNFSRRRPRGIDNKNH